VNSYLKIELAKHGLREFLDVTPPKAAQRIAARALAIREALPKSRRGGIDKAEAARQGIRSGVEQAKSIAAGHVMDAMPIYRFFSRFTSKVAAARAEGKTAETSRAILAWDLWGGDPMRDAVYRIVGGSRA
jgi:hypothetical protein